MSNMMSVFRNCIALNSQIYYCKKVSRTQHVASHGRKNYAVVPQASTRICQDHPRSEDTRKRSSQPTLSQPFGIKMFKKCIVVIRTIRTAFAVKSLTHLFFVLLLFFSAPCLAALNFCISLHGGQNASGVFPAHHGDTGARPAEQKRGIKGATAHCVVACAKRSSHNQRDLWDRGASNRVDHLCAIARNSCVFVLLADHEASDVVQKKKRDVAPVTELYEVGAFPRGFAKQHTVVRHNADILCEDAPKPSHQSWRE
mmetsp:Transcript_2958/g.8147  ORF Transcript_2958/g.8147 Transcript_2958/m.8147 type:complete len:256 (-) Transcript_2958:1197-1964(-)